MQYVSNHELKKQKQTIEPQLCYDRRITCSILCTAESSSHVSNPTLIEGIEIDSPRTKHAIDLSSQAEDIKPCPLCSLGFEVKYTDVLILSQFVRPDGKILSRSVTGVCKKQQRKLRQLLYMAQRAGLMPEIRPDTEIGTEYSVMPDYKWKRYNVYFADNYEPNI